MSFSGTRLAILLLALVGLTSGAAAASSGRPSQSLAITHVTVIDMTGAPPRADQTVVVCDGRIAAVRPSSATPVPRGAKIVNGRGRFLIPGLWDMHVHLAKMGEIALPLFIANGVTSVRDMGGDYRVVLPWRKEVEEGRRLGPHIKTAGPLLENAANVERMRREGTIEPVERTRVPIATPEEAARAVDLVADLGADLVKVRTVATPEIFQALGAAAKRRGLSLAGHRVATTDDMLRAGQRSIEHSYFPPLDSISAEARDAAFHKLAAGGISVVPTFINWEGSLLIPNDRALAIVGDREGRLDSRRKYLSGYLIKDWREQIEERQQYPFDAAKFAPGMIRDLREMHRAGVQLMPGTDVAVALIYPGFSLHDELGLFVTKIGMSPMEALISATRLPAEWFGMAGAVGTVETGKTADLVLLEADPLKDIANARRVAGVMLAGRYFDAGDLRRMLRNVEAAARREDRAERPAK